MSQGACFTSLRCLPVMNQGIEVTQESPAKDVYQQALPKLKPQIVFLDEIVPKTPRSEEEGDSMAALVQCEGDKEDMEEVGQDDATSFYETEASSCDSTDFLPLFSIGRLTSPARPDDTSHLSGAETTDSESELVVPKEKSLQAHDETSSERGGKVEQPLEVESTGLSFGDGCPSLVNPVISSSAESSGDEPSSEVAAAGCFRESCEPLPTLAIENPMDVSQVVRHANGVSEQSTTMSAPLDADCLHGASVNCQQLDDPCFEFPPGVVVQLQYLRSAPHLNGAQGICEGTSSRCKDQIVVRLPDGRRKLVKRANLFVVDLVAACNAYADSRAALGDRPKAEMPAMQLEGPKAHQKLQAESLDAQYLVDLVQNRVQERHGRDLDRIWTTCVQRSAIRAWPSSRRDVGKARIAAV